MTQFILGALAMYLATGLYLGWAAALQGGDIPESGEQWRKWLRFVLLWPSSFILGGE